MRPSIEYIKQKFGKNPLMIAEIGVREGKNMIKMLNNLNVEMAFAIDDYAPYEDNPGLFLNQDWQNTHYQNMFYYLSPYFNKITLVNKSSKLANVLFPDNFFDFLYIDANHSEKNVFEDISLWYPKIKHGGVIAGHDINHPDFPGVRKAVERFCKEKGLTYIEEGEDWIIQI